MSIRIEVFAGAAAAPYLPALADLRVAVFRDWPYLYDGKARVEGEHLSNYTRTPRFGLVVAFDVDQPIGCSTCLPLQDEKGNVQTPFVDRGLDLGRFFYFGESVLLRQYRGQGIGVAFFERREAHASAVSACDFATFCGVRRAADDPRKPADAEPLHGFWRKRGYQPLGGYACTMRWPEVGGVGDVEHTLDFWAKSLTGAPLP